MNFLDINKVQGYNWQFLMDFRNMDKWVQKYKCEYKLFDHRNHKYQSMFVKYSIRSTYLLMDNKLMSKNSVLQFCVLNN